MAAYKIIEAKRATYYGIGMANGADHKSHSGK